MRKRKTLLTLVACTMALLLYNQFLTVKKISSKNILQQNNTQQTTNKNKIGFDSFTQTPKNNKTKLLLVWNDRYNMDNWGFSRKPRIDFIKMGCQVTNCQFTDDRLKVDDVDAVLFHGVSIHDYPDRRKNHQRWVLFESEAPCGEWPEIMKMNDMFNWTKTYRLDADIPSYYGRLCKKKNNEIKTILNITDILDKKDRLVAWFVSNCFDLADRLTYVKELMKYISIDVFGGCSHHFKQQNHCEDRNTCRDMLNTRYKFYLSFENSLSKDYITEKFFLTLSINTIPVVRGDGNYTAHAPTMSHINTKDFKNPQKLAEYLLYLDKNPHEYLTYFQWKDSYTLMRDDENCLTNELSWCKLCHKLNDPNEPYSVYPDLHKWWGKCRKANDTLSFTKT